MFSAVSQTPCHQCLLFGFANASRLSRGFRWVNLWVSMPADLTPTTSDCDEADDDAVLSADVFYGNTALVLGLLVAIFVVHVAVVSMVEAYWLAEVRDSRSDVDIRTLSCF